MKRFFALLLSVLMLLGMFSGCQKAPEATAEPTEAPGPTQSPEEQEVLRIFVIGNSHTNDATNLLYEVFHAESPDQKVMVGNMYYSGCPIVKHVTFAKGNSPEYRYMKNDNGIWNNTEAFTLSAALKEQAWDVVVLHEMNTRATQDSNWTNTNLQELIDYVKTNTYYNTDFIWHLPWANPVDPVFFELTYDPQPPGTWVEQYQNNSDMNYDKMLTQLVEMSQKYVMTNENVTAAIPAGPAIHYANNKLDQTDPDLYRDYTHLSDFGMLLCAYTWYASIMGLEEITEVNINVIPAELRHRRAKVLGDLEITEDMKKVIIESVNWALKNPWTVPTAE